MGLLAGVLLTRVSTRSAVSRSVNRVATVARSVSSRASRSLNFVFSALIWSTIVGVVGGMVAFRGFMSIAMINLASNIATRDLQSWNASLALPNISSARQKLVLLDKLAS
jgi:hypothetical protein